MFPWILPAIKMSKARLLKVVWWGDRPTQLHGVLKMPSLICASASVFKFNSNEHVFVRLCFYVRHDWWLREHNIKFWLVFN